MAEQALDIEERPEPAAADTESAEGQTDSGDQSAGAETPQQPAKKPTPAPAGGGNFITVRDRYSIYCDRAISALDMPNALAFEVEDRKQPGRALYGECQKLCV